MQEKAIVIAEKHSYGANYYHHTTYYGAQSAVIKLEREGNQYTGSYPGYPYVHEEIAVKVGYNIFKFSFLTHV